MTSQRRLPCIWRTNEQSMHNITFVDKAIFVKFYNNFVLKWLIFALYVVVVPEQILGTLSMYDGNATTTTKTNFCCVVLLCITHCMYI